MGVEGHSPWLTREREHGSLYFAGVSTIASFPSASASGIPSSAIIPNGQLTCQIEQKGPIGFDHLFFPPSSFIPGRKGAPILEGPASSASSSNERRGVKWGVAGAPSPL
jgi:hypothetical protein